MPNNNFLRASSPISVNECVRGHCSLLAAQDGCKLDTYDEVGNSPNLSGDLGLNMSKGHDNPTKVFPEVSSKVEVQLPTQQSNLNQYIPVPKAPVSVWHVAAEYYSRFQYYSLSGISSSAEHDAMEFLLRTMVPNVAYNSERGVAAVLRSWERQSLWFDSVQVRVDGLAKDLGGTLIATTTTSVTIKEQTLQLAFPHLCSESEGGVSALGRKLLGQRLVMAGSTRFEWDEKSCRVTSIVSQSDMLTPILRLLGGLEDVSFVFDRASISPEFQWIQTP